MSHDEAPRGFDSWIHERYFLIFTNSRTKEEGIYEFSNLRVNFRLFTNNETDIGQTVVVIWIFCNWIMSRIRRIWQFKLIVSNNNKLICDPYVRIWINTKCTKWKRQKHDKWAKSKKHSMFTWVSRSYRVCWLTPWAVY